MPQRLRQRVAAQGGADPRHRNGPVWFLIPCGLAVCAGLLSGCQPTALPVAPPAAVPVTVSVPIEREIFDYADFTGSTEAVKSVDIRARVTGYLEKVCFQDGSEVKEGDLLFEIDPRPFQAKYDDALAQIKLCEADLKYRKAELARTTELLPKNAVSRSDYDQSVAKHDQAAAALASAQATAEEAKLNLGYTKLHSPVDGEISRTLITKGNLVGADQTLLTNVVSVDPIYVYFTVDENTILQLKEDVRTGKIKVKDKELIPVEMELMNEKGFPHRGYVDFMDNQLDPNTGTISVRGVFKNPRPAVGGRVLKPGYFARVRVAVAEPYKALLVAERALAVGSDQGQKYVLVVDDQNVVQYRPVTLGKLDGQLRVIQAGLKPGQRVIVGGLLRVRPGMTVAPKLVGMESFLTEAR